MAHQLHTKEFVIGATVGSLLGSVAALLAAPKSGEQLREDICDAYCTISDTTQDWADRAKTAVNGARKTVKGWVGEEEEEDTTKELLIGGVAGAVIGVAIGLLLAPKSGEKLRREIADTYEDVADRTQQFRHDMTKKGKAFAKTARSRTNKWLNIAQQIVEDLTEDAQAKGEDLFAKAKGMVNNNRFHDVVDWASLGYRLWQGVKGGKR